MGKRLYNFQRLNRLITLKFPPKTLVAFGE